MADFDASVSEIDGPTTASLRADGGRIMKQRIAGLLRALACVVLATGSLSAQQ
jgi:hypothetical protein